MKTFDVHCLFDPLRLLVREIYSVRQVLRQILASLEITGTDTLTVGPPGREVFKRSVTTKLTEFSQ